MNKAELKAAGLVAAVYVYFLIFAEFAFIELARPVVGDGALLRAVMGALGAGGVAGAVLAAWKFDREEWGLGMAGWLGGCGLAALAAAVAVAAQGGLFALGLAGGLVGVALGGATVWLAAGLRAVAGARRLGLVTGAGTGVAYAICNVPVVFEAAANVQAGMAACVAAVGAAVAWGMESRVPAKEETGARGVGAWVVVFLALVWMDSAAFYIIQHTDNLKAATWGGAWMLWGNAATHLGAAVAAGRLLDRGRAAWVVGAAALALVAACHWITDTGAAISYVAGVSLYSAALVYVPARIGRAWAAAAIFAVAGWVGSALGIGMAQDLHGVPDWFAAAALTAVAVGLGWRRWRGGVVAVAVVVAAGAGVSGEARADEAGEAAIFHGREVYVAEGCIHCHSQYVRPGTDDVTRWGPAKELAEILKEKPPLLGNRRQGPDLLNVGNRRTPEWNRLHLIAPRAVSPGSRMPSYARLFAEGDSRGEDLLAYLASRGAGTEVVRAEAVAAWKPAADARADAALGAAWFARSCVQCHGPEGRGDGALAAKLGAKPADLTRAGMDRDAERLARIIKFGRPDTAMAGHEALTDEAVVSLARYVAGLQGGGTTK